MANSVGYVLYIDEAGDEGIDRVRPLHADGASEYFVLAGVIIRSTRVAELRALISRIKEIALVDAEKELHFRDLDDATQQEVIRGLAEFKAGLICVASNKRNVAGYRNKRVEKSILEIKRNGRAAPQKYNWFYNNAVRYLLETASKECARWSGSDRLRRPKIDIVFSLRKEFSYSQTQAYLEKMRTQRHPNGYFNNLHQIDWSVVSPYLVRAAKGKDEPGLQFADCVASSVYRALDEDNFGTTNPEYLEMLAPRFLKGIGAASAKGHGFKLLPLEFTAPLSREQRRALISVGYTFAGEPTDATDC